MKTMKKRDGMVGARTNDGKHVHVSVAGERTTSRRECSVSEKQSCVLEKVLTKRKAALDALAKY